MFLRRKKKAASRGDQFRYTIQPHKKNKHKPQISCILSRVVNITEFFPARETFDFAKATWFLISQW